MALKIYDRQVNYEVAYVRIERDNAAEELAQSLLEFGTDGASWSVEPSYIILLREMGTLEVPAQTEES